MRNLLRLALVAASLAPFWAACSTSSSDNEAIASLVHRLLLAAGTETSGDLESFIGRLPDGLPEEPPRYPDAELIVSSRQPAPATGQTGATPGTPRPMLYFIVLDTPDGRADVYDYYERALDEDPWQLEAAFSSEQLDTLQFSDVADADITGAISIAPGGGDGRTSILISLQDAGAFVEEPPPFQLGESLAVPKEFPASLPVYEGATVTQTAFLREPGSQSFLLIFLTTDSQDNVLEFYRGAFQANGWSALAGTPFGLAERLDFQDEAGEIQGQLLADRFADDQQYTEVRLQVQLSPARPPGPTGEPTPEPTQDASTP